MFAASMISAFWSVSSLSMRRAVAPVAESFSISTPAPSSFIAPSMVKVKCAAAPPSSTVVKVVTPAAPT